MHAFKLILILACLLIGTGCVSSARSAADHVVTAGTAALLTLDAIEAERLKTIESPTEDDLASARERVGRLRAARDALQEVANSGDLRGQRAKLLLALRLLRLATTQARSEGINVPSEVDHGLATAEAYLATHGGPDG